MNVHTMETPSSSSPSSSSTSSSTASSSPDKYNVRWTTHHSETWSAFSSLLASGQFVDVTLSCRNRTFRAHRVVLSACSPYLRDLLDSDAVVSGGGHPIVILQDATPEAVEHVIEFMYTGNVDIPSQCLSDFIKLAECFQVRGIKGESEARPSSSSSPTKHLKPDHGLPSPPSSTHDEDGDQMSPKRKLSTASSDFTPHQRKQFEAQMVHRYFRSLYGAEQAKPEAEPMVTIEKVYLQNEGEEHAEDEPCDFSMGKTRKADGEFSPRAEDYVIIENGHGGKRRHLAEADGDEAEDDHRGWDPVQPLHGQRQILPVEVTMGEDDDMGDEEAGATAAGATRDERGIQDDEGGNSKPVAGRVKNDRNPPALLPYQSEPEKPFNIPADVSPESPLFRVSNSDTIWVGKTYNNWTMYFCSLCPYQSRIKSHLWRHSVKHTGQKPFVCALCLKAFSRRDNLKQHMNYKHPGYDLEPKRDARQGLKLIKGV